jgi:hypothetical protein
MLSPMVLTDLPRNHIPKPLPSRRRVVTIVAVYSLAIGFGVALFSGSIPGLGGHFPTTVSLYGHEYYPEWYSLPTPAFGSNSTAATSTAFHNVTFAIWVTNWGNLQMGSAFVHTRAVEANGTNLSFVLGGWGSDDFRGDVYVSPDRTVAAEWPGGYFLELLVAVAPA